MRGLIGKPARVTGASLDDQHQTVGVPHHLLRQAPANEQPPPVPVRPEHDQVAHELLHQHDNFRGRDRTGVRFVRSDGPEVVPQVGALAHGSTRRDRSILDDHRHVPGDVNNYHFASADRSEPNRDSKRFRSGR
jgi:hypothetical protein